MVNDEFWRARLERNIFVGDVGRAAAGEAVHVPVRVIESAAGFAGAAAAVTSAAAALAAVAPAAAKKNHLLPDDLGAVFFLPALFVVP